MAKIAVFIDHEIMIRHFLKSGVFQSLEKAHEVFYVFPEKNKRVTTDPASLQLCHYKTIPVDSQRAYLWQRLYQATLLMTSRRSSDKKQIFKLWRESLGWRPFLKSWFWSWPFTNNMYKARMLKRLGRNETLTQFLKQELVDAVIHPTVLAGLFVSDLVQWGNENKPPVIFLMNSWDNPSMKAMTMGSPDALVVWGEQTKVQANRHLGIPNERIYCLGAAQFDIYREHPALSKENLIRELGLNPERKTLLYAGSSKGLNEVAHLQLLENAIEKKQLRSCQIIFRPHPWRGVVINEPDFFSIQWKYIKMDPQMSEYYKNSRTDAKKIYLPDYEHTHSLLNAVDAVVSPVSTILLEAAIHGKPILAYMPEKEIEDDYFIRTMANMSFMKEFFIRFDCGPCLSQEKFIKDCNKLLDATDEQGISEKIKSQTAFFISPHTQSYGEQLVALVNQYLTQGK